MFRYVVWVARILGAAISVLLVQALWSSSAHAQDSTQPSSAESLVFQVFQSITEHKHEWAGAVIRHGDGSLSITAPVRGSDDSFRLHVKLLPTDKLIAIYHSHPGHESEAQVFSTDDIEIADKLNVDSYVWFEKTQSLRVYHPHRTETSTLNTDKHVLTAVGERISEVSSDYSGVRI